METPKLKRCPFCGNKGDIKFKDNEVWIECEYCHARGPYHSSTLYDCGTMVEAFCEAIDEWNIRDNGAKDKIEEEAKRISDRIARCC